MFGRSHEMTELLRQLLSGDEAALEGLDAEGGVRALLLTKKEKGTA